MARTKAAMTTGQVDANASCLPISCLVMSGGGSRCSWKSCTIYTRGQEKLLKLNSLSHKLAKGSTEREYCLQESLKVPHSPTKQWTSAGIIWIALFQLSAHWPGTKEEIHRCEHNRSICASRLTFQLSFLFWSSVMWQPACLLLLIY